MRCFIVLPCFNEEKNIKPLIYSIDQTLKPLVPYRIIAVDDGSRDRTGEVLKDFSTEYPVEVHRHPFNMGLGAALRTGLLAAAEEALDDDFVVTMDSDNTHDPQHVLEMLAAAGDASVVVGSRYVPGGRQLNVPVHRVFMSKAVNLLVRELFHLPVKDATSGFRCFRGDLLRRLRDTFRNSIIESDGFAASLELLFKAVNSGGIVVEVPIFLDYGKKGGASKMHLFSTIVGYMILLLRHGRMNSPKRFG